MTTTIDPVQTFKIVIIGDSNVGKTSLMNRLVHGVFSNRYSSTIGVDFKIAMINIGEYKCRLQIWDTAGQERFRSMTNSYFRGADGIIIVYDVTNNESFSSIKSRLRDIEFYCDENVPRILIGNKDDEDNQMDKVVLTHYAQELAQQNNFLFFETSVKDNTNITEVFNKLAKIVLQRRLRQATRIRHTLSLEPTPPLPDNNSARTCCFT